MPYEFKTTRRIDFADTDMAGIVHFSNFFKYMENTEHAFYRSLGTSVVSVEMDQHVGWPRVHAACDYRHPLRFEDEVEVHLRVREKKPKALTYEFVFTRLHPEPVLEVARGRVTVVSVAYNAATGLMASVPLPDDVARQIEVAPEEEAAGRD